MANVSTTRKSPAKPAPAKASEALQDQRPAGEQTQAQPKVKTPKGPQYAKYSPVDTHVFTVVPGSKGKKAGTKAGDRWAIFAANSGKSLAEIRAAYEKAGLAVKGTKSLSSDIRWNLKHNLVTFA